MDETIKSLKVDEKTKALKKDIEEDLNKTLELISSALALVAALAWNDAIKGVFELLKSHELLKTLGFLAPFVYAILVTVLVLSLTKRLGKKKGSKKKKD